MVQDGQDPQSEQRDESLDQDLDELSSPPSNKKLLCIAFVSFQSFATIQIFVALYAGSEAMLGDSVAMMVDALTYLFNLIAERQKEIYASKLKQQNNFAAPATALARSRMVLQYRKYTYQLELIPPLISVSILLIVTVLVMKESIHTLILDTQRDASLQSDPNINLMVIFSFFNLLLDMLNVGCFASASHAFGYKTNNHTDSNAIRATPADTTSGAISDTFEDENLGIDNATDDYDLDESEEGEPIEKDTIDLEDDAPFSEYQDINDRFNSSADKDGDSTNLNMCSAYTHVFADTLRSFAVIVASLLAKFVNMITPEVADAAAAIVVSILIFLSLFPLIGGMVQTFKALKEINGLLKSKDADDEEENNVEMLSFAKRTSIC